MKVKAEPDTFTEGNGIVHKLPFAWDSVEEIAYSFKFQNLTFLSYHRKGFFFGIWVRWSVDFYGSFPFCLTYKNCC